MTSLHLVAEIGESTVIRPPVMEDAEPLFRQVDDNREYLREWLGWVDECTSVTDTREFVERVETLHAEGKALTNVIIHEGVLAGVISLHVIDWINLNAGIGYWLGESFQGRGLMTQACKSLLDYLFEELCMHRAEIRCAPGNVKSQEIPRRLGFTYEGTVRQAGRLQDDRYVDLMIFSMLEHEWREGQ